MTGHQPSLPPFSSTDAWILLSVAMSDNKKGASVRDLIAVGDYINHAIFTGPELRSGFAKFINAGYVEDLSEHFFLAGKAREFWATLKTSRKPLMSLLASFETFLGVMPGPAGGRKMKDVGWQYPLLTDEVVDQAYQEYVRDFWAVKTKVKKPKKE